MRVHLHLSRELQLTTKQAKISYTMVLEEAKLSNFMRWIVLCIELTKMREDSHQIAYNYFIQIVIIIIMIKIR